MFEIKHLKTLVTLANEGNIRRAADVLFISHSALSHQIKDLEQRLDAPLFVRNTAPVEFTKQGHLLLQLGQDILPKIDHTLVELKEKSNTSVPFTIAIACHACFQWLLPLTEDFSQQNTQLDISFLEQIFPEKIQSNAQFDLLFTDEKQEDDGYVYQKVGEFEVVAVFSKQQALANKAYISAENFRDYVLLTYPVKTEQLDVFTLFLNKHGQHSATKYQPKAIKQVANSHMILQMVAANMGMATLPDWLINSLARQAFVQTKQLGEQGVYKTLYARYQQGSTHVSVIEHFIPQTVAAFSRLYNTKNI